MATITIAEYPDIGFDTEFTSIEKLYTELEGSLVESTPWKIRLIYGDRQIKLEFDTEVRRDEVWDLFIGTGRGEYVPIGVTIMVNHDNIPDGYLIEDGSLLLVADYPDLYAAIGNYYGYTTLGVDFRIPDSRGHFPRFISGSTAIDPDRASRTNRGDGTTGNAVGTKQIDQIRSHTHAVYMSGSFGGGGTPLRATGGVSATSGTSSAGGFETRPINIYKIPVIRVF